MKRTVVLLLACGPSLLWAQAWSGYGHDPQHTATSTVAAQHLISKHWCTQVDLTPGTTGTLDSACNLTGGGTSNLYVHYGSPLVTAANTVIVPVTQANGTYQLQAYNGATGAAVYTASSCNASGCFTPMAPSNWTIPYGPALSLGTRVYYPGPGGTIFYRSPDAPTSIVGEVAFYGTALYNNNQAAFNGAVNIITPLTADRSGNIFFGYQVTGSNPANLPVGGGIARVSLVGTGTWKSATTITGDPNATQTAYNASPALSPTQTTVYVVTTNPSSGTGYLALLNATTLAPIASVALNDPRPGFGPASVFAGSSAAPMVGPDGDVYFGVLEASFPSHNDRGWLLHFNAALSQTKTPGSFGWDTTPSVVPSSAVPSYTGTSSYLILTKYNNYDDFNLGNGMNQVAVLDPSASQPDEYNYGYTVATVMKEIITVTGVTPNSPSGVREWCINSAAIDPYTKAAIINSEDGTVYRWDFTSNTLLESLNLVSPGRSEAYTPTLIGPDGTVYAINDAVLFAVGKYVGK